LITRSVALTLDAFWMIFCRFESLDYAGRPGGKQSRDLPAVDDAPAVVAVTASERTIAGV